MDIPISVLIGFTGGWFYSLYSIVNRYRTGDIPPGLIIQLAYQMLFSGIVAYFATTLSPEITDQVVAFCVGFIPYADLATYLRVTGSARLGISGAKTPKEVEADTSLRTFEWMSSKDIARLEEEEIQTIEHLAMANPISLYLVTSYQMSQIVEWINIAYLRRLIDQDIANKLKPMGILGAIGVSRVQANSNQNFIKSLAEAFGKKQPHINNLVQTLATDPKVSFLNKLWDEFSGT